MEIPNYKIISVVVWSCWRFRGSCMLFAKIPYAAGLESQDASRQCQNRGATFGASTQSGFAFEDNAGTLRFVTNVPCDGTPVVALKIRRTVGNAAEGRPVRVGANKFLSAPFRPVGLISSRGEFRQSTVRRSVRPEC